jgi:uncharacterized membrane protein
MRKKMTLFLLLGIIGLLLGIIMAGIGVAPRIVPVFMIAISSAWIAVVISTRGGTLIKDEMVIRVESMSGNYTTIGTLYFVMVLSIVNFFYPLPLSIAGLLLTMMLFMSLSYVLVRYFLLRQGKAE